MQDKSFYLAVVAVSAGTALTVLDGSIANLALPTIVQAMRTSAAASIWIVNAYQLAVIIALLPLAALGEIIGYRRVFQAGMALFTFASLLCAAAHSLTALALFRGLQGIGGAGVMCVGSALLRAIYQPRYLGRGIGINSMVVATSLATGPMVAGAILTFASWPWLFAINFPLGLAALALGYVSLPDAAGQQRRFDKPSALLNALTFGLFVAGLMSLSHGGAGFTSVALLALAAAAGSVFFRRQLSRQAPLLPVDLLGQPVFALSICSSVFSFIAQMMAFVTLPFLLHDRLGLSPGLTGLMLTPWPIAVAAMAPIAGRLADRYPAGLLGLIGLTVAATGLAALSWLPGHAAPEKIIWRVILCGVGFALFQTPNTRAIISATPKARSGGASGMIGTARVLGQSIGAAFAALIFKLASIHAEALGLRIAAVVALLAAGISVLRLARPTGEARNAGFVTADSEPGRQQSFKRLRQPDTTCMILNERKFLLLF